ncbi:iron-containing alcohol dehydrogenase [bacterium]|nr:iron-containing alcohol dehydrogenase [bacterium]
MQNVNWNYPTPIRFGCGRLSELDDCCRSLGMNKPLLVTDAGLAALPLVRELLEKHPHFGLFSDVRPNPVGANVESGVTAYRAGSHDGVVAMGGGSALDVGKAVALMVGQDRPLWDFEDLGDNFKRVNESGMAPVVAVPTTSGTGSEVGRCSVITDESTQTKRIIFHPRMLPGLVLADPDTTLGLPPKITAAVGMDALSHNLEAWFSPFHHPMADGIALEGCRLVGKSLVKAYQDGGDRQARADMMAASTMGAVAFQKGLGAMHSLAHPIGALFDTHHGLTNAVVMPYVLAFNASATHDRLDRLARYLGVPSVLEWVLELRRQLRIPETLQALGIPADRLREIAEKAVIDPTAATNPIPLTVENCLQMLDAAWSGRL